MRARASRWATARVPARWRARRGGAARGRRAARARSAARRPGRAPVARRPRRRRQARPQPRSSARRGLQRRARAGGQARSQRRETEHAERVRRVHRRAADRGARPRPGARPARGCATSPASPGAPRTSSHATDRLAEFDADAAGRDPAALRAGVELVEDTRQRLIVNVTEELALEALAYRLESRAGACSAVLLLALRARRRRSPIPWDAAGRSRRRSTAGRRRTPIPAARRATPNDAPAQGGPRLRFGIGPRLAGEAGAGADATPLVPEDRAKRDAALRKLRGDRLLRRAAQPALHGRRRARASPQFKALADRFTQAGPRGRAPGPLPPGRRRRRRHRRSGCASSAR